MGFRFKKSINLGGGVRLNVGKKGVAVNAGVKGFRVSANTKGVRTTASLPGTGLSYTKQHSYKKNTKSKRSTYTNIKSNASSINTSPFLNSTFPKELRSNHYNHQTMILVFSILLLLVAFSHPILFLPAFALMFWASKWRIQTDWIENHYLKAYKHYTHKRYGSCISELDKVLEHPGANKDLELLKAESYSNLGNSGMAYRIYKNYFENVDLSTLSDSVYWSHKASAIDLLVNKKAFDLALVIAQSLPEEKFDGFDFSLWKNHMKGMCFLGKNQYELALECFKTAVGRTRSMDYPCIDCHYFIGVIYAKLVKKGLAKKKFQRVYAADPTYKNTSDFIDAVESDGDLNISLL